MLKKRLFGLTVLIVGIMMAFTLAGCGDNGDPSGPPWGSGGDDKLVLSAGYAWVPIGGGWSDGKTDNVFIFYTDGTCDVYSEDSGGWAFTMNTDYSVIGNKLSVQYYTTFTYSISADGNELTLYDTASNSCTLNKSSFPLP